MPPFDVVGDVLGDVLGEDVDGDVLGMEDLAAIGAEVVKHARRKGHKVHRAGMPMLMQKAAWRAGQLAPGVQAPEETMVPLPLTPQQNNGQFTSVVPTITFQGQLQKPYRGERLLVSRTNVGTSATPPVLLGQIFVGTDLQQADIAGLDIGTLGAATAFGTRLTLLQAPPGVLIRIPVTLSVGLSGTDTITAAIQILGRYIQ